MLVPVPVALAGEILAGRPQGLGCPAPRDHRRPAAAPTQHTPCRLPQVLPLGLRRAAAGRAAGRR
jgi:hypothetical protein